MSRGQRRPGAFPNDRPRLTAVVPTEASMAAALTQKQTLVLRFVASFIADEGMPPTYDEISLALGLGSPNGVKCHLHALAKKGYLTIERGTSRGLRLVGCSWSPDFAADERGRRLAEALGVPRERAGCRS